MKLIRSFVIMAVVLYVLHELGHILMFILFGMEIELLIFPLVAGTYHIIGFVHIHTQDMFSEMMIRFVGPILLQLLFILLIKREPRWIPLGILFSYGDLLQIILDR